MPFTNNNFVAQYNSSVVTLNFLCQNCLFFSFYVRFRIKCFHFKARDNMHSLCVRGVCVYINV